MYNCNACIIHCMEKRNTQIDEDKQYLNSHDEDQTKLENPTELDIF